MGMSCRRLGATNFFFNFIFKMNYLERRTSRRKSPLKTQRGGDAWCQNQFDIPGMTAQNTHDFMTEAGKMSSFDAQKYLENEFKRAYPNNPFYLFLFFLLCSGAVGYFKKEALDDWIRVCKSWLLVHQVKGEWTWPSDLNESNKNWLRELQAEDPFEKHKEKVRLHFQTL
jgi:hypothetical protein